MITVELKLLTYACYVNQQDTIVVHVQISLRNDNNCDIISMYTYICIFNKIFYIKL